jgi:hypothetical protein
VTAALTRSRGILSALIAACVLLAGWLALAGDARAARGMELALQDDTTFLQDGTRVSRERAFQRARQLGVTRLRVNLLWTYTMGRSASRARRKPKRIAYDFTEVDSLIDAAAKRGIRIHLSLTGPAPRWANAKKSLRRAWYKPNARYFGQFASIAAEHFAGRVDRYSIWNEPNYKTWLGPIKIAPRLYRSLYTRGYAAIKKADPRAKVLIGETSPYSVPGRATSPLAFLRKVTCANKSYRRARRCSPLRADGYAQHPYDFRHAPQYQYPGRDNVTIGTLRRLTRALDRLSRARLLRKNGRGRMPVYLTEYGYFASGRRALPKRIRSRYLQRAYSIALRNSRVKSQLQYLLVAPTRRSTSAFFNLALLTPRGKPYPQFKALRRWYRVNRRKVKRPGGPITLPPAKPNPVG